MGGPGCKGGGADAVNAPNFFFMSAMLMAARTTVVALRLRTGAARLQANSTRTQHTIADGQQTRITTYRSAACIEPSVYNVYR